MTWNGFLDMWNHYERLRDTHNAMFCTSEESSVGRVWMRDQLDLCHGANWVSSLHSAIWHSVRNHVVGQSHILVYDFLQAKTCVEFLARGVHQGILPDDFFFALGRQSLVIWRIELKGVCGPLAVCEPFISTHSVVKWVVVTEVFP